MRRDAPSVALLIDYDNLEIGASYDLPGRPLDLGCVVELAQRYGTVVVARAYADWGEPNERLAVYESGIEPCFAPIFRTGADPTGKSLADTVLVADGVDILWRVAPDFLVLVTSDKDILPLARLARLRGTRTVVVGSDRTAVPLRRLADEYVSYRDLVRGTGVPVATHQRAGIVPVTRSGISEPRGPRPLPEPRPAVAPARSPLPRPAARPGNGATEAPLAAPTPLAPETGAPTEDSPPATVTAEAAAPRRRRRRRGGSGRGAPAAEPALASTATDQADDLADEANAGDEPLSEVQPTVEAVEVDVASVATETQETAAFTDTSWKPLAPANDAAEAAPANLPPSPPPSYGFSDFGRPPLEPMPRPSFAPLGSPSGRSTPPPLVAPELLPPAAAEPPAAPIGSTDAEPSVAATDTPAEDAGPAPAAPPAPRRRRGSGTSSRNRSAPAAPSPPAAIDEE
jgi:hypothetical protein